LKEEGVFVWDVDGKKYFDFFIGLFSGKSRTLSSKIVDNDETSANFDP
jgi:acetylornithine/succinyldiaminopimelate/putrescine aminotransferase